MPQMSYPLLIYLWPKTARKGYTSKLYYINIRCVCPNEQ